MIVNLLILCLVIVSFVCVYKSENCDIKLKYALYSLCAIIFVIQLQKLVNNNMNENFTPAEADEALQNIASMYNKDEITVKNLKVTGNLAVTGDSDFGGNITGAKNLTITGDTATKNVAIGNVLVINDPANPQGKAWQMNNYAGTLMTSSNKSGARGAIQVKDDGCGDGTILTQYLQPGGDSRMIIGTSFREGRYEGKITQRMLDGSQGASWGYCNGV